MSTSDDSPSTIPGPAIVDSPRPTTTVGVVPRKIIGSASTYNPSKESQLPSSTPPLSIDESEEVLALCAFLDKPERRNVPLRNEDEGNEKISLIALIKAKHSYQDTNRRFIEEWQENLDISITGNAVDIRDGSASLGDDEDAVECEEIADNAVFCWRYDGDSLALKVDNFVEGECDGLDENSFGGYIPSMLSGRGEEKLTTVDPEPMIMEELDEPSCFEKKDEKKPKKEEEIETLDIDLDEQDVESDTENTFKFNQFEALLLAESMASQFSRFQGITSAMMTDMNDPIDPEAAFETSEVEAFEYDEDD